MTGIGVSFADMKRVLNAMNNFKIRLDDSSNRIRYVKGEFI